MNKCFVVILLLAILISSIFGTKNSQNGFDAFWQKFQIAVKNNEKNLVAELTKFPFSMPYGIANIKTKTVFIKKYQQIFSGEADAAKCFSRAKPEKETVKRYVVACKIKGTENTADTGEPIVYSFELTKTGWRFAGFDNINE
jgi:hypothetical protein